MSDVGAIGLILKDYREMLVCMNNKVPTSEYEYGIHLLDLIIKDIKAQGIDLF
jgi:hypothetical protein